MDVPKNHPHSTLDFNIEPADSSKMLEYLLVNLEGNHSHEDLPFKDPDSYLEHILDQSTSCPNTTGVEWYTVLDEVKDFVLACEGYIKLVIASIGLVFTVLYLAVILCRPRKMTSFIQGMMAQLFIIECLAMLVDLAFALMIINETPHCGSYFSAFMIAHVIHPLENSLTYCSIMLMIIIAENQVKILRSPMAYDGNSMENRGFMKTFGTTKYVYLVALLIAIPRAGESKVVDSRDQEVEQFVQSANSSLLYCPVFNDHRFFAAYTWLYRTCLIFIPTLFAPLTYLGYNVYRMNWMIKRRSKMENRPKNQDSKSKNIKKKTAQMCKAFICLIILLLVCYSPSFCYGLYQSMYSYELAGGRDRGCSATPLMVHKLKSLCELSTTFYSALCGLVYCSVCPNFRRKVRYILTKFFPSLKMNVAESTINDSQNPNMIELEQLSLHTLKIVAENIPSNVHQMANEV